jgi:alpha-1,2-glucosyltransferase
MAPRSRLVDRWLGSRAEACAAAAAIGLACLCALLRLRNIDLVADERVHLSQIEMLMRGDLEIHERLTTIPGYHAAIALLARMTGTRYASELRVLSALIGLPVIAVFYLTARQLTPRFAAVATLQFAFLPVLFPLFFVLYTDAFSLLLILLAVLLALHHHRNAAAAVAIISVLVRQTNIFGLALVLGLVYLGDHGLARPREPLATSLRRNVVFVLGLAGFAVFAVVNRGVAVGDRWAHPLKLSLGNVYLFLFLYFFLVLPVHLADLKSALARLADRRMLGLSLLLYGVFMFTFTSDHPYNQVTVHPFKVFAGHWVKYGSFLHNELLHLATRSVVTRTVFFIPVLLSCLLLRNTRLVQPRFLATYPLLLLLLTPSSLIEYRYGLIPLTLLLLARERRSPALEYATAVLGVAGSMCFVYGLDQQLFFP